MKKTAGEVHTSSAVRLLVAIDGNGFADKGGCAICVLVDIVFEAVICYIHLRLGRVSGFSIFPWLPGLIGSYYCLTSFEEYYHYNTHGKCLHISPKYCVL